MPLANRVANLILHRFLQRGKQQYVRRMRCVYTSLCIFLSWPHSSGSQSSIICDRQSIAYLSRTLPLTSLYTSFLYYCRDRIIYFSPPFQAPPSLTAQRPGVMSWNDGLCEAGKEITLCSPIMAGYRPGHPNRHLIQPNVRALLVEIHLGVLEQVFLGDAQRKGNR